MYQYYSAGNGDMVVKYFFPENRIAGSMTATLTQSPSNFTIKSLEDTDVLEYNFMEFKKLVAIYPDIAAFYIRYLGVGEAECCLCPLWLIFYHGGYIVMI
jgi:hypothetical protein